MGIFEIILVIHLLVWVIALVSIIRNRSRKGIYTVLWLLAIFLLPVVGVVAYFLFGRRRGAGDDISGGNESMPFDNQHFPPPGNSDDFSNMNHS